jgi:type IV secretory pathway VirB4 component
MLGTKTIEDLNESRIEYRGASYYVHQTSIIRLFRISFIDLENSNLNEVNQKISSLFSDSSSKMTFRFIYSSKTLRSSKSVGLREEFSKFNKTRDQEIFLVCEFDTTLWDLLRGFNKRVLADFEESLNLDLLNQIFTVKDSKIEDIPNKLSEFRTTSHQGPVISRDEEQFGIIKLKNLSSGYIHASNFGYLKNALGFDFTVVTTIRPFSKSRSEIELRRLSKKRDAEGDLTGVKKKVDTERALTDITLEGQSLCEIDMTIFIGSERASDALIPKLSRVKARLDVMGEFCIEKHSVVGAYYSSCLGQTPSMRLQEITNKVTAYLPVFSESDQLTPVREESLDLVLQRKDYSLSYYDYFNKSFKSHNYLVIGQTGSGKSVLTGLLIDNITAKGDMSVQILDVGSSHTNTVKALGGKVRTFSLSKPSGINPFKFVNYQNISVEDRASILSSFISNLVLENGEDDLSRTLKAKIEKAVISFVNKFGETHIELTINDFLSSSNEFERKDLLKRYAKGGMYQNIFMPIKNEENLSKTHLEYFDFEEIFQATDTSFSKAGMSALITCFNYSVLTDKTKKKILFIDECPVFIKENYEFLASSAANIRKFGGSLCILAQTTEQLCPDGKLKLLSQLKNKFLYTVDGRREEYIERLHIDDHIYDKVKNLSSKHKIFSEVLFTNGEITKTYILKFTPDEYYKFTTDDNDKKRIEHLRSVEKGITKDQALRFYSLLEKEEGKDRRFV